MSAVNEIKGRQGLGAALVLFSTLCLSAEAVAAKIAYRGGATVLTTLTLRYIIAAAVFWLLVLAGRHLFLLPRKRLMAVAALSLGGQTLTVLALFHAFNYIPAAMAILFLYFFPVVVAVLAHFFLKEPLTRSKGIALLLTFGGCAVILAQPLNGLDPRGVIMSLAAAATNSIFLVGTTRLLSDIEPTVYNAYVSTLVTLAVGALALSRGQLRLDFDLEALAAVVVLGIICTVLAMAALLRGIREIGASRAAIISTFEPAATAVLGFVILGEALTAWQMAGGLIILAGVLMLKKKS